MRAKFVAAKLFELAKRLVKFDKSFGVYTNGYENSYAERVERIINNSATAKPATKLFRKYIVGKGFGDVLNVVIVNKEYRTSLRKFLFNLANSYAYQNGVFIHVNYNLNYKIDSLKILPYKHCLVGKKDDKDWNGKILIYDNWNGENGKVDKKKVNVIDAYNPDKKVIETQIQKAGGIKKYKGQVFFYNPEETIYPLAHIDNVLNDADSEYRVGQFKNTSLIKGFFGKKIVVTPPMIDGDLRRPASELSEAEQAEKQEATTERDNFRKQMQTFVGSDNVDGMLHLEMEFEGDDIDKVMKFINVDTNINDKLFAHTEISVGNNIAKSLMIPSILINQSDNSIFGNSGALLVEAKKYFQEQTEEDRDNIENEILNPLFKNFQDFTIPEGGLKIIPLIQDAVNNKE
jgi:hypothetical protein